MQQNALGSPGWSSNMDTGIDGKTFLITGAAEGIGFAVARHATGCGANVLAVDVNAERLDAAVRASGGGARAFACDVSDEVAVAAAVQRAEVEFGRIDVLVNCAVWSIPGNIADLSARDWRRMIDINLNGVFHCVHAVLQGMIAREDGVIINLTSGLAQRGVAGQAPYCAVKAAINLLTSALHQEVCHHGIRVHALSPGVVDTSHARRAVGEDYIRRAAEAYADGQPTRPETVASMVQFLSSAAGRALTGGTPITLKP